MRTTKKLVVLCLAALMACMSMMPATFSWYARNSTAVVGGDLRYSRANLPVSGSTDATVSTIQVDKDGKPVNGNAVSTVSFSTADTKVQYYKTTINNKNGSGDIYGDLELGGLINNNSVKAGITSPVINEKGFDISKEAVSNNTVRIYFVPTAKFDPYWTNGTTSSNEYDMNICYTVGGTSHYQAMSKLTGINNSKFKDHGNNNSSVSEAYYFDIPSNTSSFFFYNHWYNTSNPDAANNDWNRTPDIKDIIPGTIYYLNGKNITDSYKLYDTDTSNSVAALMKYYSDVELDVGGNIDISLAKENENNEDEFSPDYNGTSISYARTSGNNKINVDSYGNITVDDSISFTNGVASAVITTTIKGVTNSDSITATTNVKVRQKIEQMPIAQNVLVEKGKEVDLYWYVIDKRGATGTKADSIFWTY